MTKLNVACDRPFNMTKSQLQPFSNWKEQGMPTWCGEMNQWTKWQAKMQQHLQYYTNAQS